MITVGTLILASIFLITLIFLMRNFSYIVTKTREVCEEPSGYFKFGQLVILIFVIVSFISILAYNMFINPHETSIMDVFLTVTVGILGTVVGLFYGSRAEEHISKAKREVLLQYRSWVDSLLSHKEILGEKIQKLIKRIRELEDVVKSQKK